MGILVSGCFVAEAEADAVNADAEGGDANIVDNGALKCFASDHDTHLNQSHPQCMLESTQRPHLKIKCFVI